MHVKFTGVPSRSCSIALTFPLNLMPIFRWVIFKKLRVHASTRLMPMCELWYYVYEGLSCLLPCLPKPHSRQRFLPGVSTKIGNLTVPIKGVHVDNKFNGAYSLKEPNNLHQILFNLTLYIASVETTSAEPWDIMTECRAPIVTDRASPSHIQISFGISHSIQRKPIKYSDGVDFS